MKRAFLVTGTDTGIGKTLVASAIAASLSARMRVGVLKPAETGCREQRGVLVPDDAVRLQAAAASKSPLEVICPFRYAEPLAPWLAAERAARPISIEHVRECFAEIRADSDVVLVESAGGLLVPLALGYSYAHLALDLELSVVVVVGSRLGALNQTLLTLECASERRLPIAGYVMNQTTPKPDLAQQLNAGALARLTAVPCLGELPFLPGADALTRHRLAELGAPLAAGLLQAVGGFRS